MKVKDYLLTKEELFKVHLLNVKRCLVTNSAISEYLNINMDNYIRDWLFTQLRDKKVKLLLEKRAIYYIYLKDIH